MADAQDTDPVPARPRSRQDKPAAEGRARAGEFMTGRICQNRERAGDRRAGRRLGQSPAHNLRSRGMREEQQERQGDGLSRQP